MIPIERYEAGYRPTWEWRTEDCYIWMDDKMPKQNQWRLRVNESFSEHPTLQGAREEASRILSRSFMG